MMLLGSLVKSNCFVVIDHRVIVAVGSMIKIFGASGLIIGKMQTSDQIVSLVGLNGDGKEFITVGESGQICFWEYMKLIKSYHLNLKITHAAGNSNHKKGIFLISFSDGFYSLQRLNLNTGALKLFKKFKRVPSCMQLSADGNYLAVGGGKILDVFCFKNGFSKQR